MSNLQMNNLSISEATEYAIELLGKNGGIAVGEISDSANLRWANSSLTTNGNTTDSSLSVAAFIQVSGGTAIGIASAQIRTKEDVKILVEQSKASALAAGVNEDSNQLVSGTGNDNFYDSPQYSDLTELEHIADGLSAVMANQDSEYFGYSEISTDTTYLATSSGIREKFLQQTSRFELCAKSNDRLRSSWSGQSGESLFKVNVQNHANNVNSGLDFQKNQIEIKPGKHKVTLSESSVADLMIYLMWTSAAREAAQGRSVFSSTSGTTRVGEQLTKRKFNLFTDPNFLGLKTINKVISLGSSSFASTFDTGLEIPAVKIISDGKLAALGSSRHAAQIAKLPFTPLADNIIVSDAEGYGNLSETAARMGNGLLITCLWYIREVDPESLLLTGLTRDGVYVVSGGEIVGATRNFRFNDSPVGLLNRIVDAGESQFCLPREWADWFSRAKVSPLTIEDFNLSTKSDAI